MAVTINQGTQTSIKTTTDTGAEIQHIRTDGGTIGSITGMAAVSTLGTVVNLNFGTVDSFYRHPDAFATVISSGTSVVGTIKAAVSGSAIYVTDLIVSAGTATNVEIGNGGTSLPLVGTLFLNTNGGAVMNFRSPVKTSVGSALVYKQSVNGPVTLTVQGYVD
jgi:hypothetical protein